MLENIAGNTSMLVGKAAEAQSWIETSAAVGFFYHPQVVEVSNNAPWQLTGGTETWRTRRNQAADASNA